MTDGCWLDGLAISLQDDLELGSPGGLTSAGEADKTHLTCYRQPISFCMTTMTTTRLLLDTPILLYWHPSPNPYEPCLYINKLNTMKVANKAGQSEKIFFLVFLMKIVKIHKPKTYGPKLDHAGSSILIRDESNI